MIPIRVAARASDAQSTMHAHLSVVLACLRAMQVFYQTLHWQAKGATFYGDHLLFMRLYAGDGEDSPLDDQVDTLAEKLVGFLGNPAVDPVDQVRAISYFVDRWAQISDPFLSALQAERDLQNLLQKSYDAIEQAGGMTLGLDDWIMATANDHESNMYLLQQVLDKHPRTKASAGPVKPAAPSAEGVFYKNPLYQEVSEFATSGAISNSKQVTQNAVKDLDIPKSEARAEIRAVKDAPYTPDEIMEKPGAKAVGTLNRLVVDSEDPGAAKAIRMNRQRMAAWLQELK